MLHLPYEIFLALRYLRSGKRRRVARVTAFAAVLGIACGVAALIVATATANGFRGELQDKILRGTAHLTLTTQGAAGISDWQNVVARVRSVEGVRDARPTTYTGALIVAGGGHATYTILRGVAPNDNSTMEELRRTLIAGTSGTLSAEIFSGIGDAMPVVIGAELAAQMDLRVGDEAYFIAASSASPNIGNQTSVGNQSDALPYALPFATRTQAARIIGIFSAGLHEYDAAWIYAPLNSAARLDGDADGAPSIISVELDDLDDAPRLAALIRAAAEEASPVGFDIVTWQKANAGLFAALELERRTVAFIITLITFIATLNILTTLTLLIVERRSHIAILRAMGARTASIMLIFIIEGSLLGATGAGFGAGLGLVSCWTANRFRLVSLPADVYSIAYIPLTPRFTDVLLAVGIAFIVSLLATLYPAHAAARVRPSQAMKEN